MEHKDNKSAIFAFVVALPLILCLLISSASGAKLYTPGDKTLKAEGFPDDNYTYLGAYKSLIRDEAKKFIPDHVRKRGCLLYTSPSPRD